MDIASATLYLDTNVLAYGTANLENEIRKQENLEKKLEKLIITEASDKKIGDAKKALNAQIKQVQMVQESRDLGKYIDKYDIRYTISSLVLSEFFIGLRNHDLKQVLETVKRTAVIDEYSELPALFLPEIYWKCIGKGKKSRAQREHFKVDMLILAQLLSSERTSGKILITYDGPMIGHAAKLDIPTMTAGEYLDQIGPEPIQGEFSFINDDQDND